jgi:hypothetical protein
MLQKLVVLDDDKVLKEERHEENQIDEAEKVVVTCK